MKINKTRSAAAALALSAAITLSACGAPAPAAPAPTADPAPIVTAQPTPDLSPTPTDPDSFGPDFAAALAEGLQQLQPGTAGSSLRLTAFTARLADLFTAQQPDAALVTAQVEGLVEAMEPDELENLYELLRGAVSQFRKLSEDSTLLTGCGYEPTETWDAEALAPLFDAMVQGVPADVAYSAVLDRYTAALAEGMSMEELQSHDLNYMAADTELGYLIEDLDGNGLPELLIGAVSEEPFFDKMVLDLYTLSEDDGFPVLVFRSRERDRLYYAGENRFANVGSSGADNSVNLAMALRGSLLFDLNMTIDPEDYVRPEQTPLSQRQSTP